MSDNKELNDSELNEDNKTDEIKKITLNRDEVHSEEIEERGSSTKRSGRIVIITLIFAIAVIFMVFNIFFNKKTYANYDVVAEYAKNLPEDAKFTADYGKLIGYNNEGISIYDANGRIEWNAAISMTNPKVTVNNGYAVAADIGGRNLLVVNYKSVPAVQVSMQMLQDIMLVDISEQGELAVLMETEAGYNIQLLNPYDKNQKLKAEIKTYSKDDGYALSVAMSKDGSKLVTEYVKNENGEIKSTLTFYNFDKIGENSNADRIVGVFPFENTIFPKLKFADNNTICAYGDNKIVCFEAKREPEMLWEKKVAGRIERIAEDETGFALLINESDIRPDKGEDTASDTSIYADYPDEGHKEGEQAGNGKVVLYAYSYGGSRKFSEIVDINIRGMWMNRGEIILHSDHNSLILDSNGNEKFKNKFKDKLVSFLPTDNSLKYYTVFGKKLKIIKLRE